MATIKDVAKLAQVSTSTVSHVINNNRYVSPEIRQRIESAINELNYIPSALGRSLKRKETHTIGMIVTQSNNPFFAEVVQGVEQSCYELGYNLILCNTERNQQRLLNNIEILQQKCVDGIIALCTETYSIPEEIFARNPQYPMVMMDWAPLPGVCDIIQDNSLQGAIIAVNHLIENGFDRIACITGPLDNSQAKNRLEGYQQALTNTGMRLNPEYIVEGNFQFDSGVKAMKQLLALTSPPNAIFCCNDAMAIGAYQTIHQAGLKIGKDIAIIGYDNIEIAQYMSPALTTIHQSKKELGQLAVEMVIDRISNRDKQPVTMTLTPELVIRNSVINHS